MTFLNTVNGVVLAGDTFFLPSSKYGNTQSIPGYILLLSLKLMA